MHDMMTMYTVLDMKLFIGVKKAVQNRFCNYFVISIEKNSQSELLTNGLV